MMEHEPKTYLRENGENDVESIVIVTMNEQGGQYRVTEKRPDGWCKPFWMPGDEFRSYDIESVGGLTDDQFDRVLKEATNQNT